MRKTYIAPIAVGVLLALAGTAQAATKTDGFTVSATVNNNCLIDAGDLNLGVFDGTNTLANTSTITVRCTTGTTYNINLSTGASTDYQNRRLYDGTAYLEYNLYTANDYATIWGDTTNGTGRPPQGTGNGLGVAQTLFVYGRLQPTLHNVAADAGSYSDSITATIIY